VLTNLIICRPGAAEYPFKRPPLKISRVEARDSEQPPTKRARASAEVSGEAAGKISIAL
jgi:hypothetical protein